MYFFRSLIIILCLLLMSACTRQDKPESTAEFVVPERVGATPWTDLAVEDSPEDFHFVIVSDRTCCARPGVFASAMPKINLVAPAFIVSVGDFIEGYTESQQQLTREWDQIESYIAQLEAPFFYTPGNHDMSNALMAQEWQQRFGASYYHFMYKDVLFLVLNSELFGMVTAPDTPLPGPWKQSEQMDFARSVLEQYPDPRWTIVLLHQPLWAKHDINPDWLELEERLGNRKYTVFAGHYHHYSRVERHNRNFITLATTGGGSHLRGAAFGELDHVAWVTMKEDGPRISNLELDGIFDEDISNPQLLKVLNAISSGVIIETPVVNEEIFTASVNKVIINNPTQQPITVSPSIGRKSNFDISGLVPVTVAPGEQEEFLIQLSSKEPVPYRDLKPASVQWIVTGIVDDRPVQFPLVKPLLPLTKHVIGRTASLNIDGDLSDWGELNFRAEQQGDVLLPELAPEDASFRFDIREGSEHLYIAVDVTDDDIQLRPDTNARLQDAIRLSIDIREPAQRDKNMGLKAALLDGHMAAQISTILPTGNVAPDKLLSFMDETNAIMEYRVVRTSKGYAAELAIPLSYMKTRVQANDPTATDWREARISISLNDLDGDSDGITQLHWQPNRYGAAALSGTQLFIRQ